MFPPFFPRSRRQSDEEEEVGRQRGLGEQAGVTREKATKSSPTGTKYQEVIDLL